MATSPTVPMYAPDGTLGDIPYERMHEALNAGGKMAVNMTAPDGTPGVVPADKVQEAVKAGGKVVPYNISGNEQEKEGAGKNYVGILKNAFTNALSGPSPSSPSSIVQGAAGLATDAAQRKEEGRSPAYNAAATAVSAAGIPTRPMEEAANKGDTAGVLGAAAGLATLAAAPTVLGGAAKLISRSAPAGAASEFFGRSLPKEALNEVPASGKFQPALSNTPKEVISYAASKGIDLTPGQATGTGAARTVEAIGERSLFGGTGLEEARNANAQKLASNIQDFASRVDPKAMGTSAEAAGENIKQATQAAKEVTHENASAGYKNIDYLMPEKINAAPISNRWDALKESLPMGAEDTIRAQVPRNMSAVVEDMLSGKPEGFKPTFEQGIKLRSFFRELGDTEGLPNSQQVVFRQMSNAVDSAMETTAQKLGSAGEWRDANAGWKDYTQKYGDPQSPLYRILKQNDPAKITNDLLNRSSARDVEILKQEGMTSATDALKRQVLTDVANKGFRVSGDGLASYPHSFINTLFGPEMAKELYLNADLARRFKFQVNPSGTSNVLLGVDQLRPSEPSKMMIPMGAAKASMPRPANSYLPGDSGPGTRASVPLYRLLMQKNEDQQ